MSMTGPRIVLGHGLGPPRQRPEEGVERRVESVLEEITDDVGHVKEVDVECDGVDVELPVVGVACLDGGPVVHAGAQGVHRVLGQRLYHSGQLNTNEWRQVEADFNVRIIGEQADAGGVDGAPIEGDPDDAEAPDAFLGKVESEAELESVENDVQLLERDGAVGVQFDGAVLEVHFDVVAQLEGPEVLAA